MVLNIYIYIHMFELETRKEDAGRYEEKSMIATLDQFKGSSP